MPSLTYIAYGFGKLSWRYFLQDKVFLDNCEYYLLLDKNDRDLWWINLWSELSTLYLMSKLRNKGFTILDVYKSLNFSHDNGMSYKVLMFNILSFFAKSFLKLTSFWSRMFHSIFMENHFWILVQICWVFTVDDAVHQSWEEDADVAHEDMDHRIEVLPKAVQHNQTDDWNIEKQNSTDVRDTGLQGFEPLLQGWNSQDSAGSECRTQELIWDQTKEYKSPEPRHRNCWNGCRSRITWAGLGGDRKNERVCKNGRSGKTLKDNGSNENKTPNYEHRTLN